MRIFAVAAALLFVTPAAAEQVFFRGTLNFTSTSNCAYQTVGSHYGSMYAPRLIGDKEQHRMGHVPGVAHPSQRDLGVALRDQRLGVVGAELADQPVLDERRVHQAGHHRVAADAALGVLHRHRRSA